MAQFLCLDGRVSGQSSERLLACHSDPCLRFKGIDLGLFPAGSMGRLRRLGFVLWAAGLYRTREFCVAARFFLMEDGPESADRWPAPSVCRHPTLLQVQITPRRAHWGLSTWSGGVGRKSERNMVQSLLGRHIGLCTYTYAHTHTHTAHTSLETEGPLSPRAQQGLKGRKDALGEQ